MARHTRKITPEPTTDTDFRVPVPSNKYTDSLDDVPKDGAWYIMAKSQGLSTAEQTARGLNHAASSWVWGWHARAEGSQLVSDLAVRWAGPIANP